MDHLKGNLIVTVKLAIPVNEHQYALVKRDKGAVTAGDIIAAEENNYLANPDEYLLLMGDYISEVEFAFERTANERPNSRQG